MFTHKKIVIEDSILGNCAFADYYRFGTSELPIPMLCYIGGSINRSTYLSRIKSQPQVIVDEFHAALQEPDSPAACDLLVSSAPPCWNSRHDGVLKDFFRHFMFEVLPKTPNHRPAAMAFIGNSFGAHLASYLAFSLANAKALATIAGCGMAEAARKTAMIGMENKRFILFSNTEDGTEFEDGEFKRFLEQHGHTTEIDRRQGGHAFDDYRANGSLADAFRFCLLALRYQRRSTWHMERSTHSHSGGSAIVG